MGKINALAPDFVCFTGDLVEDRKFLPETLEILSGLKAPLFGVPGNHDSLSGISFAPVRQCFAATGGAWLMDEHRIFAGGWINLIGITCNRDAEARLPINPSDKSIFPCSIRRRRKGAAARNLTCFSPAIRTAARCGFPFSGRSVLPSRVDGYGLGLFPTKAGPLYVNAGIGYIGNNNFRFNCRPEITLIEV